MLQDIPVVWCWLAHAAGKDKLRDQYGEEPMRIQETQSLCCAFRFQDSIQFVVNALSCDQWEQRGITYEKAFSPGIHIQLVTHHQAHGAQHPQWIAPEDFAIDRF